VTIAMTSCTYRYLNFSNTTILLVVMLKLTLIFKRCFSVRISF